MTLTTSTCPRAELGEPHPQRTCAGQLLRSSTGDVVKDGMIPHRRKRSVRRSILLDKKVELICQLLRASVFRRARVRLCARFAIRPMSMMDFAFKSLRLDSAPGRQRAKTAARQDGSAPRRQRAKAAARQEGSFGQRGKTAAHQDDSAPTQQHREQAQEFADPHEFIHSFRHTFIVVVTLAFAGCSYALRRPHR